MIFTSYHIISYHIIYILGQDEVEDYSAKLERIVQLTGFSDPIYAEADINVHQYDITLGTSSHSIYSIYLILSFYHSIILSFYHSIILSFSHSIILSFCSISFPLTIQTSLLPIKQEIHFKTFVWNWLLLETLN
jgi:hypothetical protein